MDCDLVEVSGQMVLPLPNLAADDRSQTVPRPPSPGHASVTRHRPIAPARIKFPKHTLVRISDTACRWSAPRPARSPVA